MSRERLRARRHLGIVDTEPLLETDEFEQSTRAAHKRVVAVGRFAAPPTDLGTDAPGWTPALVQDFLEDTYAVKYSYPSCRWLLKEAGLSYQKPRRSAAEADEADRQEFHDELKKRAEIDAIVVRIDQTKKSFKVEPRAA